MTTTTKEHRVGLEQLREQMLEFSDEQLRDAIKQLEAVRAKALAERLRPFKTPVTESTMRRSSKP